MPKYSDIKGAFINSITLDPKKGQNKNVFIEFGEAFTDDEVVIEGVVTHIIYDARNDVFDDTPCI